MEEEQGATSAYRVKVASSRKSRIANRLAAKGICSGQDHDRATGFFGLGAGAKSNGASCRAVSSVSGELLRTHGHHGTELDVAFAAAGVGEQAERIATLDGAEPPDYVCSPLVQLPAPMWRTRIPSLTMYILGGAGAWA